MKSEYFSLQATVVALLLCLFMSGCSKEEQSGNRLPRVTKITLSPTSIVPGDIVRANVKVKDPEGDAVEVEYQWYVNEDLIEGAQDRDFSTRGYGADARVYLMVRAIERDTGREGEWRKSQALVLKPPPTPQLAGVTIEPENLRANDTAEAVVDYGQTDPFDVEMIYYRWLVNGEVLLGEDVRDSSLSPEFFGSGDRVQVMVCTDDQFTPPHVWKSKIHVVPNARPEFVSDPEMEVHDDYAIIYFEIQDPDGDDIEYYFQGGPAGTYMNNASQGAVIVDFTSSRPGGYTLQIGGKDSGGATVSTGININIPQRK